MTSEGSAVVHIERPAGFIRDAAVPYTIRIDGETRGEIIEGGKLELSVTPGRHVVQARVAGSSSAEVEVMLSSGGSAGLLVKPAGRVLRVWRALSGTGWIDLRLIAQGPGRVSRSGNT